MKVIAFWFLGLCTGTALEEVWPSFNTGLLELSGGEKLVGCIFVTVLWLVAWLAWEAAKYDTEQQRAKQGG